jgi:hypothetical protein
MRRQSGVECLDRKRPWQRAFGGGDFADRIGVPTDATGLVCDLPRIDVLIEFVKESLRGGPT